MVLVYEHNFGRHLVGPGQAKIKCVVEVVLVVRLTQVIMLYLIRVILNTKVNRIYLIIGY